MKANLDCVICHQRQALRIARAMTPNHALQEQILREAIKHLSQADWDTDPMTMATGIYTVVNRITGNPDPYKAAKYQNNEEILQLYPELQKQIRQSEDPLLTACKFAVAGNIIDLSIKENVNIHETLRHVLNTDFAINHYPQFKTAIENASSLLLFADNAGEIVFDRLLIDIIQEHRPLRKITLVVKETPILNDATMDDVHQVGLATYSNMRFLTVNGWKSSNRCATWMHPETEKLIQEHDVAISKGQANYEVMSDLKGLFFLLIAKCEIVASDTGTYNGALIFKYNS